MNIILVGPRTFNGYLDGITWNVLLPLQSLGHEVFLLDTVKGDNDARLHQMVEEVDPDLIFCVLSTGNKAPFFEPLEAIQHYTENTDIITFNWFADDIWRFDKFSSDVCWSFDCCSTTEKTYVDKFKEIGYDNIIEANWHANEFLYSHLRNSNHLTYDVTFIGKLYPERKMYIDFLKANGVKVNVISGLSFEQMISVMSNSLICLNFSSNPNAANLATQMKGRMFEILATGALLVTEYHEGIEEYFEENKEAVYFKTKEELLTKLKKLLDKPRIALNLSEKGFERYLSEHTSKHRLSKLLDWIMDGTK